MYHRFAFSCDVMYLSVTLMWKVLYFWKKLREDEETGVPADQHDRTVQQYRKSCPRRVTTAFLLHYLLVKITHSFQLPLHCHFPLGKVAGQLHTILFFFFFLMVKLFYCLFKPFPYKHSLKVALTTPQEKWLACSRSD